MSEIRTLRPGLLVSMNTSIKGNVHYQKVDLENAHVERNGEQRARWETTRVISDPAEHEMAVKVRDKVRNLISGQCATSAFGLLCPENNADALREAMVEARQIVDGFNDEATLTRMSVNVIYGRIAQDDVEAVRAIAGEIRGLMEDMQDGLKTLNVKAVRDAANKARSIGGMLSPEAKGRIDVAIDAARKAARQIVKAGEEIAIEVDRTTLAEIDGARTAFLDLETEAIEVAAPVMDGRDIDLETDPVGRLTVKPTARRSKPSARRSSKKAS